MAERSMNVGLFVLGIVLVLFGLVMYGYSQSTDGFYFGLPNGSDRPYASMGAVILIAGLLVTIFSAVTPVTTRRTVTNTEVVERPKKRVVVKEERV